MNVLNENIINIKKEADRCLNCKVASCKKGCPLENDIPEIIKNVKEEKYEQAYNILCKTTFLGSICGRICPHYSQCMGNCIRAVKSEPVKIGEIEAFVSDLAIKNNYKIDKEKSNNKKVLIIGSGPAGLTAAAFLKTNGCDVTIYEKYNFLGGILAHSIPEFRLNKDILKNSIDKILNLGIKVKYKMELGKNFHIEDVINQFDAIFLAIGANISSKMNIDGENLDGVYGANELLEKNEHPNYKDKSIAVIGGGNVAMDCARTIKRLGAKKVTIIYRRQEEQMPAEKKEIKAAKNEGIEFLFQTNIIKILGNKKVEKLECIKTDLIKKEGEKRLIPVNIENSNFILDIDYIAMAVGSTTDENVIKELRKEKIEISKWGNVIVNEKYQTTNKKIYAGGDIIGNKATIAWAAKTGRQAAKKIIEEIS